MNLPPVWPFTANESEFFPRLVESMIRDALSDTPVVCVLGARQCGKTALVKHMFPNRPYVDLDTYSEFVMASEDPGSYIERLPDSVTIDEVQKVPNLIGPIKVSVDQNRRPGRFILTGSVNLLLIPGLTQTLAGRMEIIDLHPLTESEKSRSGGNFLFDLFDDRLKPDFKTNRTVMSNLEFEERIISGGYVEPLNRDILRARQWRRSYLRDIAGREIPEIFKIRNPELLSRIMELLAWRTGSLLRISELAKAFAVHRLTLERYLAYLERVYLVRRIPAWHSNKTKRLTKSPKIHFVDCGLAATLTDFPMDNQEKNRVYLGHLCESFVVQQIIAHAGWTNPDLRFWHYRDKDQVEVDLVMTLRERVWGFEIKSKTSVNSRDAKGLIKLANTCGNDFQKGILFYRGSDIISLAKGLVLAVPVSELWTR